MLGSRVAAKWALFAAVALGCAGVGCSSSPDQDGGEPADPCTGNTSSALKTCAGAATLKGVDVSYYQGTVDWTKVKAAGRTFAFARVSDGVSYPDTKFAQNWPAMKSVGIVRGVYQFFRPNADVNAQVNLLVSKLDAAGGLQAGDLPPVLDLESDGGLPASTVVARAKQWLALVEAKFGVKPIVYTAAFMSNVIGNNFGTHTLWVANYGATCPTMPSGWTDWHFWQDSDSGQVGGIPSNVDTNLFNGTMADLLSITLKAPTTPKPPSFDDTRALAMDDGITIGGEEGAGEQGATIGSSSPAKQPASAPFTPCLPLP